MSTSAKKIGFPQEICDYIGNIIYQESLSDKQRLKYHSNTSRKLKLLNNLTTYNAPFFDNKLLLKRTLYDKDFKIYLPRYGLHADPFEIYLSNNINYDLWSHNYLTLKERLDKTKELLSNMNDFYIFRKLTEKAINEGYYSRNKRNHIWKII